jgi:hypothetical protein
MQHPLGLRRIESHSPDNSRFNEYRGRHSDEACSLNLSTDSFSWRTFDLMQYPTLDGLGVPVLSQTGGAIHIEIDTMVDPRR